MSEPELRALHQRYQAAQRTVGKAAGGVPYQTFVSSLQKQVPDILVKQKCAHVTFDVQVKDNKVVLRAQPKR
jgi:predicted DNA binding CopG/RHH family protein